MAALADTVADLKADLAAADTSDAVAAIQSELANVQADLADLLASNNVYTPDATNGLVINSAASLEVAKSLGGKLAIINGSVNITNSTAAALNAADLQAVLDVMVTITGSLTYTQSGDGASVDFDSLTSVGNVTIDNEHGISFAELTNAGVVNITSDNKVTSFSAPKLSTLTNFTSDTLDLPKATSIDLSALAAYPNATLTINGNNVSAGFDLMMPLIQSNGPDGVTRAFTLTIGGHVKNLTLDAMVNENSTITANDAKVIVLDNFKGTLTSGATSNHIDVTLGAAKNAYTGGPKLEKANITGVLTSAAITGNPAEGPSFNFDAAAKLVSATIAGEANDVSFNGNTNVETVVVSADAVDVDFNGATSLISATVSGDVRGDIDFTGATSLETVVVSGASSSIDLNGNTSLTSVTLTGSTKTVEVIGATSLTTLDLAHTTAFPANKATGVAATAASKGAKLVVKDNTELTSLKADKVTLVSHLEVTNNPELTSVSFDAITAAAAAVTSATVYVGAEGNGASITTTSKSNKLYAQKKTLGSDTTLADGTVKNTGTITTDSGLADLAVFLKSSIAKASHDVAVIFDRVDSFSDAAGNEDTEVVYGAGNATNTGVSKATITTVANSASNTAAGAIRIPNAKAYIIDATDGSTDVLTLNGNGGTVSYTKLATEDEAAFVSRVVSADGLSASDVAISSLAGKNKRKEITFAGTATTTTYTATWLIGSTGYASATVTPTSATNAKIEITVAAAAGATAAQMATAFATAFNDNTKVSVLSWNVSATGNYTPTTVDYTESYKAVADGAVVSIHPLKTVNTSATATSTVIDLIGGTTPTFTMFGLPSAVTASVSADKTDHIIILKDELYGDSNNFNASITSGGSATVATAILEDANATGGYSATTGAFTYSHASNPYNGGLTRADEFDKSAATSTARTNTTQPVYVTTYWTWN